MDHVPRTEFFLSIPTLKRHWGFVLLLVLLLIIILTSFRPSFFIMGWDNFSVSLDSFLNFPRSLFATWREYRGVGVPSDSEVTDIFRQLLLWPWSAVYPSLAEYSYNILTLVVGTVAVYALARSLLGKLLPQGSSFQLEFASFAAAFFYLFNLNTLATFYYPMPMYVTRYAFLPLLVFFWFRLIQKEAGSKKIILGFIAAALWGSVSYLTATVFFTFILVLLSIVLTQRRALGKQLILLFMFLGLQAFWLLPFAYYYVDKAPIITKASTFVDVNESLLHEDEGHFSWEKILTLYPNFFYTQAIDLGTRQFVPLHPLVSTISTSILFRGVLLLFPIFYLFGSSIILLKFRSRWVLWVAFLIFFMIILARKTYPPLGFIYEAVAHVIPYFKVIFRFGDSKFFPLLSFAGSIAAAVGILVILDRLQKRVWLMRGVVGLVAVFFILKAFVFQSYLRGSFISPLMYIHVPDAYREIAQLINRDPRPGRVLHLPYEKGSYWKSYSWGYMGSTFLAFLLDKPLLDRTFAPGSVENDFVDLSILHILDNVSSIYSEEGLAKRAQAFSNLLYKVGVRYIIWDETVAKENVTRGTIFWGEYQSNESQKILDHLVKNQALQQKKEFTLPPYSKKIILYELVSTGDMVQSPSEALVFHAAEDLTPEAPFLTSAQTMIHKSDGEAVSPFLVRSAGFRTTEQGLNMTLPFTHSDSLNLTYDHSHPIQRLPLDLYVSEQNAMVSVFFFRNNGPKINGWESKYPLARIDIPKALLADSSSTRTSDYLADWFVMGKKDIGPYRLSIDGFIIPLPASYHPELEYLATILVPTKTLAIELLTSSRVSPLDISNFELTEDPNCTRDKQVGYEYQVQKALALTLTTQDGTSCLVLNLRDEDASVRHREISLDAELKELEGNHGSALPTVIKTLEAANAISLCLLDTNTGACLNNHQILKLGGRKSVILPSQRQGSRSTQLVLQVPTLADQKVEFSLHGLIETTYVPAAQYEFAVAPIVDDAIAQVAKGDEVTLKIPKILSTGSFFFQEALDAFSFYTSPCEGGGLRTTRRLDTLTLLYSKNCQNGLSIPQEFDSNSFLLLTTSYSLLAGAMPKFQVADDWNSYLSEYLSFYQGYPNVPGLRTLDQVDTSLQEYDRDELLVESTSLIYPQPEVSDSKKKLFTLVQNPANMNLLAVAAVNIIELPEHWQSLILSRGTISRSFSPLTIKETRKLLPSLWQTFVLLPRGEEDALLTFGQGYDPGWQLYPSALQAFLGIGGIDGEKVRVDGWSNGWILPRAKLSSSQPTTLFIFYTPERLAILGWGLTILAIFILLKYFSSWSSRPTPIQSERKEIFDRS